MAEPPHPPPYDQTALGARRVGDRAKSVAPSGAARSHDLSPLGAPDSDTRSSFRTIRGLVQVPTIHARNRRLQVRDFRHSQQDLDGADGPVVYSYPIFVVTGSLLRGTGASRAAGRHRHCHRSRRRRPHCVVAQRCVCAATRCAAGTPCSNGLCGLLHEWRTICSPYGATDGVSVDERFGGHGAGHLHVRNGRRAHAQQQPVAAARAPQCSDGRSLLLPVPRFAPARFGEGLSSRNGEPLSTAALAVVVLHDRPGLGFAIGAPLIVAAVVTASLAKGRPQRRTAAPPVAP